MKKIQMVRITTTCPDCNKSLFFSVPAFELDCATDGFDAAEWELDNDEYVCAGCAAARTAAEAEEQREADEEAQSLTSDLERMYREFGADAVAAIRRGY